MIVLHSGRVIFENYRLKHFKLCADSLTLVDQLLTRG